jgi:4-aminobutyrate aminotransferase-like enzyme/Ser/Thr protein kinase RdoA (MazF antagonist)
VTPVVRNAPCFSLEEAEGIARELYRLETAAAALASERDQNFRLADGAGTAWVLKISNADETAEVLDLQNRAIQILGAADTGLEWPQLQPAARSGRLLAHYSGYFVRLLSWVEGVCMAEVRPHSPALLQSLGQSLAAMDLALARFVHPAAHRTLHWDIRQADLALPHLQLLTRWQRNLIEPFFSAWQKVDWGSLSSSVIHGDANDYNVLVDPAGARVVSIIDFGDVVHSATVCNLAVGVAYAMLEEENPIAAAAEVVRAYHRTRRLERAEIEAVYTLACTRLAMSVCYCEWQTREAPRNPYLRISNTPVWKLIEKLAAIPPDWPTEIFLRACGAIAAHPPASLATRRRERLGPSLSLSYREPLHLVRGSRQYLYDSSGRAYLDCVNNVAHVGHCHPRVVEAAARQTARLNTNTRYLDENLVEYLERLTALFPEPLRVVYLVCSGSEAGELALRLARRHTGRNAAVVVDTAYHGNTSAMIDLSPYKFNGPGGAGKPAHVEVVPLPDTYRGLHRGAGAGASYAAYVAEAARKNGGAAAFFCESAAGCGGQVIPPAGYLRAAFDAVREAGGLAVADEVQTGFGRAGSHFWMFETQGAAPDIVTLGKPIGNGHPMGAVITTRAIAASFDNGMEYFNTFGGNPVSCAVGLAVLDAIRDERLQENARDAGDYLRDGLAELARLHPLIGDVRGRGLFLGFELVRDRETLEPAAAEAEFLVNRMKESGVLLSTDGPLHNVIKIKPPLVFTRTDADAVLEKLDAVLRETR